MSYRIEIRESPERLEVADEGIELLTEAIALARSFAAKQPGQSVLVVEEQRGTLVWDTCCSKGGTWSQPLAARTNEAAARTNEAAARTNEVKPP